MKNTIGYVFIALAIVLGAMVGFNLTLSGIIDIITVIHAEGISDLLTNFTFIFGFLKFIFASTIGLLVSGVLLAIAGLLIKDK